MDVAIGSERDVGGHVEAAIVVARDATRAQGQCQCPVALPARHLVATDVGEPEGAIGREAQPVRAADAAVAP